MNLQLELSTITSSLAEISGRISTIVESTDDTTSGDTYIELVAAERAIGTLLRRLRRVENQLRT
ncbi:MAG: hypothetical protein WCJ82_03435 [Actinomycetota bacterium]